MGVNVPVPQVQVRDRVGGTVRSQPRAWASNTSSWCSQCAHLAQARQWVLPRIGSLATSNCHSVLLHARHCKPLKVSRSSSAIQAFRTGEGGTKYGRKVANQVVTVTRAPSVRCASLCKGVRGL